MGWMELEILAPMLVAIVLILTVGGVVLLRPLSRRLGELLEVMAREREQPHLDRDVDRLRQAVETLDGRLALLEERVDFTDALLADPERRNPRGELGAGDPSGPDESRPGKGGGLQGRASEIDGRG